MDQNSSQDQAEPKYSENNLSCFSHVKCAQVYLLDCSDDYMRRNVNKNEQLRSEQLGFTAFDEQYKTLIIVGPSGVGKSTLIKILMGKYPGVFKFSISYTTRAPREGEKHGVNYFFVSKEEFQEMVERDEFVEWCHVHGNMYGTSKIQIAEMQKNQLIPLLDIDIQGTEKFLTAFPQSNTLFLFPPTVAELQARLEKRGTETPESLQTRMINAKKEITQALVKDDPKCLIGYRVINKDLKKSSKLFDQIIEMLYERELKKVIEQHNEEQKNLFNQEEEEDTQFDNQGFINNMDIKRMAAVEDPLEKYRKLQEEAEAENNQDGPVKLEKKGGRRARMEERQDQLQVDRQKGVCGNCNIF